MKYPIENLSIPGEVIDLVLTDNFLFCTTREGEDRGFYIINTEDPQELEIVGSYNNPDGPSGVNNYNQDGPSVVIRDQYAFIADGANELVILDISNITYPQLVGSYTFYIDNYSGGFSFAVHDDVVYYSFRDRTCMMINISNPSNPNLIGEFGYNLRSICVQTISNSGIASTFLYAHNGNGAISIYNISIPYDPQYIRAFTYTLWLDDDDWKDIVYFQDIHHMSVETPYLYIQTNHAVYTIDVSLPYSLEIYRAIYNFDHISLFLYYRVYTYIIDENTLKIYSLSRDDFVKKFSYTFRDTVAINDVVIKEGSIILAKGDEGISIIPEIRIYHGGERLYYYDFVLIRIIIPVMIISLIITIEKHRNTKEKRIKELKKREQNQIEKQKYHEQILVYRDSNTENMIKNIKKIDREVFSFLESNQFKKAQKFLQKEILQYNHTIPLARQLPIPEIAKSLSVKKHEVEQLYYSVSQKLFNDKFQDLSENLDVVLKTENYSQISVYLLSMSEHTRKIKQLASNLSKTVDIKKYDDLSQDLAKQMAYNQYFIQYKKYEKNFNQITQKIALQKFTEALQDIPIFSQKVSKFLTNLQDEQEKSADLSVLLEKSKILADRLSSLQPQIRSAYNKLLEGESDLLVHIPEIHEPIQAPNLGKIHASEEMMDFLKILDENFANWEKKGNFAKKS
jgi:hypothetical protein